MVIDGIFRVAKCEKKEGDKGPYFSIAAVHNFTVRDKETQGFKQSDDAIWVNFSYYKEIPKGTVITGSFTARPHLGSDGKVWVSYNANYVFAPNVNINN